MVEFDIKKSLAHVAFGDTVTDSETGTVGYAFDPNQLVANIVTSGIVFVILLLIYLFVLKKKNRAAALAEVGLSADKPPKVLDATKLPVADEAQSGT